MNANSKVFIIEEGNPNGFVLAIAPALCYSQDGGLWMKTNLTYDMDGWVCIVAVPPVP